MEDDEDAMMAQRLQNEMYGGGGSGDGAQPSNPAAVIDDGGPGVRQADDE